MGYLVNVSIAYITDAILSQQDITEDESIQLTELLRTLHPLEELFILEPGQVSPLVSLHLFPVALVPCESGTVTDQNSRQALWSTYMAGSNSVIYKNSSYVHNQSYL